MTCAATSPSPPADTARSRGGAMLFTAFEPSGDDHAAPVIAELKRRDPGRVIYAWGGPRMSEAGATVVERTGENAVMGVPGIGKIFEHRAINRRVKAFLASHPEVVLHVPVDSPAANFPICRLARAGGLRVVHLVAPQVWAWGSWRIRKLKRLTDLLLCILPFEQAWFAARGLPAEFIGHPLFDETLDRAALAARASRFPGEGPRVALMPGSRPAEIRRNFPILRDAFAAISGRHPEATGVVAATTERVASWLRAGNSGLWPERMEIAVGATDAVTHWCDIALVVSGTVSLQIARQHRPMVIVYKSNPVVFALLARWVVSTEFFTLPNLVAGREIVPELVPHFGGYEPLARQALRLIEHADTASRQRAELARVTEQFAGRHASRAAADAIERVLALAGRGRVAEAPVTSP